MGSTGERPSFVARHRPSILVIASQASAAVIHGIVKILETGTRPVHPFQILQVRLLITGVGCTLYLWSRVSILYLMLSQATALNFLAPFGAMVLAKYLDHGSFNSIDRVGGIMALLGVVLVLQPDIFIRGSEASSQITDETPKRLKGVACGIVGIIGGIIALTSIRRLGSRVHPLMSINYFAWAVVLEFLLTAGISSDLSSAATVMIYSQVIWALALDRIIWNVEMSAWSLIGVVSVVCSLVLVSLAKEVTTNRTEDSLQYEAITPFADVDSQGIDLESLHASEDINTGEPHEIGI
ncbi:hypothetical protein VMCG_01922 [Cytospora schulzeri]|uniref:EamA domain-containing protein n=1 Tax=Cytospora schulzeri TaxID=448051 RepID=A0A423X3C1_9PEZI|nr:hypothetical protein VMCG_01922 [Valsa malicola]